MGTLVQRDPVYHIQQMLGAYYFLVLIFPSKDNDHIVLSMMGTLIMYLLVTWLDN